MKTIVPAKLESGRVTDGPFGSDSLNGFDGAFFVQGPVKGVLLKIVSTSGLDPVAQNWEHVSVSTEHRCPNWDEMCFVKDLFWDDEECVVQFHQPKSQYVNHHPYCLHLWKHRYAQLKPPASVLVGPKPNVNILLCPHTHEACDRGCDEDSACIGFTMINAKE